MATFTLRIEDVEGGEMDGAITIAYRITPPVEVPESNQVDLDTLTSTQRKALQVLEALSAEVEVIRPGFLDV